MTHSTPGATSLLLNSAVAEKHCAAQAEYFRLAAQA